MAFGLYKPGQGYWVRVLAATMAGVLIAAASAWLWNELEKAGAYIPAPTWSMNLSGGATGTAAPGQTVELLGDVVSGGQRDDIGTAVVRSFDAGSGMMTVGDIRPKAPKTEQDTTQTTAVGPGPAGGATIAATLSGHASPNRLFDALYLQAAGVALLVIIGSALTWWVVGMKEGPVEFLIATDGEMKKVNWSTRKDIVGSTWVVILWSVLLAGGLWAVDFLFSQFFKIIGVLQS